SFEEFRADNSAKRIFDPPKFDFVAASLGITSEQVKAWTSNLGMANGDFASIDTLSRLYTAASLCRVLQIVPEALADIAILLGVAQGLFGPVAVGNNRAQVR